MMLQLLIFLVVFIAAVNACPVGSHEWQNGCYTFILNASEFADAESECIQQGGHLTSIHDGFTNAWISQESLKYFHDSKDFWIGSTDLIHPGNWAWTDGTFMDFNETLINANASGSDCISVSMSDGRWQADNCWLIKPYVCKSAKAVYPAFVNCGWPWIYFQPTHSCYGDGTERKFKNWTLSEDYCISVGAHLPSIHSLPELTFLSSLLMVSATNIWVGAYSNDAGLTWKWSDNTPWDYNPWFSGYPNRSTADCGVNWGGGLINTDCNENRTLICQKKL